MTTAPAIQRVGQTAARRHQIEKNQKSHRNHGSAARRIVDPCHHETLVKNPCAPNIPAMTQPFEVDGERHMQISGQRPMNSSVLLITLRSGKGYVVYFGRNILTTTTRRPRSMMPIRVDRKKHSRHARTRGRSVASIEAISGIRGAQRTGRKRAAPSKYRHRANTSRGRP